MMPVLNISAGVISIGGSEEEDLNSKDYWFIYRGPFYETIDPSLHHNSLSVIDTPLSLLLELPRTTDSIFIVGDERKYLSMKIANERTRPSCSLPVDILD
jgi:hypothetical protein